MAKKRAATGPSGESASQPRGSRRRTAAQRPIRFSSPAAEGNWNRFSKRNYMPGRVAKLEDFEDFGIPFLFTRLNWQDFVKIRKPCYPHSMRQFYCNLILAEDSQSFRSVVNGVEFSLNVETICDILELPNTDLRIYFANKGSLPTIPDFDNETILNTVCIEVPANQKPKTSNLNERARVINRLLCFNIIPRGGHYEDVHPLQLFVCYCIMTGIHINLGKLIFNLMIDACSGSGVLPFGMILTVIFQRFQVPLINETEGHSLAPFDSTSRKRMGLDGGVVVEEGGDVGNDPEGQEDEEENSDDEFLAQGASVRDISNLEYRMDEKFEAMKGDLDQVKTEIGGVKLEIGDFKREMIARFDEIVEFLHTHTPPT